MKYQANSIEEYMEVIPEEHKIIINKARQILKENLPQGFKEDFLYGMITFVVPLSIYPKGYLNKPDTPLPFISIASQKHSVNFYHMGIYAKKEVSDWFVQSYMNHYHKKLDMGKSCFRFKKEEDFPFELIAELSKKIDVEAFVKMYEYK